VHLIFENRGKLGTENRGQTGSFLALFRPWLALPQVVLMEVAQHVTQGGNGRQFILPTDSERMVYLDLLGQAVKLHGVAVVGYCLMSNHVHGVVVPHQAEALVQTFKQVHGRYASYWNVAHAGSGDVRHVVSPQVLR
jgi:hypothetical protein